MLSPNEKPPLQARLRLRDSGPTHSLGLDIVFNSFESFELSRLCLLCVVGTKFIVILLTMKYSCCGAGLLGAVKTLDEVRLSIVSVIV